MSTPSIHAMQEELIAAEGEVEANMEATMEATMEANMEATMEFLNKYGALKFYMGITKEYAIMLLVRYGFTVRDARDMLNAYKTQDSTFECFPGYYHKKYEVIRPIFISACRRAVEMAEMDDLVKLTAAAAEQEDRKAKRCKE